MKSEYDILRDHQWINIHLPDLKNFSVPIRIAKMALAARLTDGEKDPLEDLSDEENKKEENLLKQKKKKKNTIEIMEIFASNPDPFQIYPLETNSSTLAFSNKHILIHDNKKLILFDLNKKINEFQWDDNDHGLYLFYFISLHKYYLTIQDIRFFDLKT
jgi:hypothetical protein